MITEGTREEFDKIDTDKKLSQTYETVRGRACECLARKQLTEKRQQAFKSWAKAVVLKLARTEIDAKPYSLDDLEGSLAGIFEPNVAVLSADEIAFHLLEEVGEVSRALLHLHLQPDDDGGIFLEEHRQRREAVREELADVFSWIVSMRAKTYSILSCAADFTETRSTDVYARNAVRTYLRPALTLVDLVWNVYAHLAPDAYEELRCEVCGGRPCNPRHKAHAADRGELFGDRVKPFFDQIRTLILGFREQ
jgi:NTP pyrophosphatase (non-canonical NTP hydrolase)